eukprot:18960_1
MKDLNDCPPNVVESIANGTIANGTIANEVYISLKNKMDGRKNDTFQFATSALSEIKIITTTFIRIAFQNLSSQIPLLICTFFIGHLANAQVLISGAGLAIGFTEVTGTAVAMGMSSAISTLVPQAIGAGKYKLIGVYFQRAFWVCCFTLIPIGILQSYGGKIMCALGQPKDTCDIISNYCLFLIIYIQFFCLISILSRIGQSLNLNTDLFYTSIFCALLSVPLNELFVYKLHFGYLGTAVSIAICTVLNAILIICVLIYRGYGYIFKPLPKQIIFTKKGISEYLGLSIPILFQIALPFWFYDLCLLLSGYVHNPEITLSAGTIIGSLLVCMSLVSEALYLTISMRVGSYIGAQSIYYAKRCVLCAFIVYIIYAVFIGIIFIIFKNNIPYVYTYDKQTVETVTDCMYIVVIRGIIYGIYINIAAVFLGLGLPKYPAYIMFFTQWILSLSIMFILLYKYNFKNDTLYGMYVIWATPALGYVIGAIILALYLLFKLDWTQPLNQSKIRIESCVTDYGSFKQSPTNITKLLDAK